MVELISNGERLGTVREKLNATLRPYASRAEFEASSVPPLVTLVNVIDGGSIYQLIRDTAGDWQDGAGNKWTAMLLAALEAEWFEQVRDDAQAAATSATASAASATASAASAINAASDAASAIVAAQAAAASAAADVESNLSTYVADANTAKVDAETARTSAKAARDGAAQIAGLAWTPRDLMRDGQPGVCLLPLDPTVGNVWTDVARTTRATAAGQQIASARLATETGFLFAEQATTSNRPRLGRYPEGGRRQRLLNSTTRGAVVGAPGTLPKLWSVNGTSPVREVIALGADAEGLPQIDLRVSGSPGSSGTIQMGGNQDTAITAGQVFAWSVKTARVGGSTANITSIVLQMTWRDAAGAFLSATTDTVDLKDLTETGVRLMTGTAPANAAFVLPQIRLNCTGAVDITMRISGQQVEAGSARTGFQMVTPVSGVENSLQIDMTEAGKSTVWYLLRSGASVSLPVTVPSLGADVSVMRSIEGASSVSEGQSIGAGAYEVLGADGSRTVAVSLLSRALTDGEGALVATWLDRQRGFVATGSTDPALPGKAKAAATVSVRQDGANYAMTVARVASEIGGAVTPAMYGGDPNGLAASDAAVAAALATGAPVMLDGEYRLTAQLNTPAYSLLFLKNPNCGIIADMGQTPAVVLGNGSRVPSLRVRSQAFPVSAIANDANWNLWSRSVRAGNDCQFGVMWLDGLAGGLDLTSVTDCEIGVVYASNMRSRYGWAAGLHIAGGGRHRVGYVGVSQSDRGCEVEMGADDVTISNYLFESIYPNGYTGAPADGTGSTNYLRTSWSGPNVHSHVGEPPCRDIRWGDGVVRDCVNPINIQSSASSDATTYPESVSVGRVVIESPRVASTKTFKEVVSLCGRGINIEAIEFRGTPAALIDAMVSTWGTYSEDVTIGSIKARAGAWYGRMTQFAVPESRLLGYDIATQDTTDTTRRANPMHNVAAGARNFVFGPGVLRSPQYHAALFHAQGGSTPSGGRRVGTRIIAAGSNQPAAVEAASFAALDAYRADNVGG